MEIRTEKYNWRRYGKPWIAKICLNGNDLKFNFGTWVGDPGTEGILILDDINPGEFYATGQKDFRNSRKSIPHYYQMEADGTGTPKIKAEVYQELATKKEE